jgi:hypothetical protein
MIKRLTSRGKARIIFSSRRTTSGIVYRTNKGVMMIFPYLKMILKRNG